MRTPKVEAKALQAGYDRVAVTETADVIIEQGTIVTLIGPNGSGKSTLLKTIAGQLPPVKGELFLDGVALSSMPLNERAKKIGVVLTGGMQTEYTTVKEVVAAGRYPYTGMLGRLTPADEEAVERAMRDVEVSDLADRPFQKLSDGQRQRVLLCRALCQEPDLLILDEPMTFLDLKYRMLLCKTLRQLKEQTGMTILLSMHETALARMLSDNVICLKEGRILCSGRPDEVLTLERLQQLFDLDEEAVKTAYGV